MLQSRLPKAQQQHVALGCLSPLKKNFNSLPTLQKGPSPQPTFSNHKVLHQYHFQSIQLERSNISAQARNSGLYNKYVKIYQGDKGNIQIHIWLSILLNKKKIFSKSIPKMTRTIYICMFFNKRKGEFFTVQSIISKFTIPF